jgi:hypothetical protein
MSPDKRPLLPTSYTAEQIENMAKTWDVGSFGMAMDARMRQIERSDKVTFVERGLVCLWVEQKEAYLHMYGGGKFRSMGEWLSDACPYSRSTAYAALGEVKKAIEDNIPLEVANKLPRCNLKTLNRLSTSLKHDPEILAAAETESEQSFKRRIAKDHPGQHVEADLPMRFKPTESQRKVIDTALDAAMLIEGSMSREDALEAICEFYMLGNQEELETKVQAATV